MKKLLLAIAIMFLSLPCLASEKIGDLYYNLDSSSLTAEVTYEKYIDDSNYQNLTGAVRIPENVVYNENTYSVSSIGDFAFYGCSGLISVEILNSVTSIGTNAFRNCSSLTSVTIGKSVGFIGKDAFYNCNIETLNIDCKYISDWFKGFKTLRTITIGNSVTEIKRDAFNGCTGLSEVYTSDLAAWCNIDFENYYANPLYYTNRLYLNNEAITNLVIPEGVTSIKKYAFDNCSSLTSVSIPNTVTSIGISAFYGCSGLTSVTIPNSITEIENQAFNVCTSLSSLVFEDGDASIILGYNKYSSTSYTTGKGLFADCPLESLYLGRNIQYTDYSWSESQQYGYSAFYNQQLLKTITIGNTVTNIPAFLLYNCEGLTNVTIPNSVTSIGNYAFDNCSGLTSVTIPNSVTSIGDKAFNGCSGLIKSAYPSNLIIPFPYGLAIKYNKNDVLFEEGIIYNADKSEIYFAPLNLEGEFDVPNSVTSIAENAFYGCSGLTSVTIPSSVTSIRNQAFYGCSGLTSVTIPSSVTSIGDQAFYGCSGLTSVEFNAINCTYCGSSEYPAFPSNITAVKIGEQVKNIPANAFKNCTGLTSIEIGNAVASIGSSAFYGCSGLTSVTIPSSVTSIGESAFSGCSLLSLTLESQTPPDFYSLFSSYTKTATLNIPSDTYLKYLASVWRNFLDIRSNGEAIPSTFAQSDDVFEYFFIENEGKAILTGLVDKDMISVSIPDRTVGSNGGDEKFYNVVAIGEDAFKGCSSMTQLKLPASLELIGASAFKDCSGLKNITLPNSVTSIENSAFYGCSGLTRVEISDLEAWCNIVFGNSYANPLNEANHLYLNGNEINKLVIPNSVTSIENYAFYGCSGLTSVTIPNSVTSIKNSTFYNCSGLTSVTIPNSVTSIGSSAFSGCSGLFRVEISDLEAWCNIVFGSAAANPLYYANHLYLNGNEIKDLVIPGSVTSIKNYAFYGCSGLTTVEIPNSVTSIGYNAFSGCSSLASVEIPNSVISIGDYAFYNCDGLTSVTIPSSISSIKSTAFYNCSGLASLTLADGIEDLTFEDNTFDVSTLYLGRNLVGKYSFPKIKSITTGGFVTNIPANTYNQTSLASVTINPGAQVVIEDGAFSGSSNLAELTLPEDIAEIGANAFKGTALKNVTVPGGVIGDNAFANCKLDNIILGANVESIGEYAFDGSNTLKNVYATPVTPPAAQNNTFSYYEAQLWVPEEAIDTYYNYTRCWYRFNGKPLVCPENIEVTGPASFSGKPGDTLQLTATISPANVTLDRVLWRSTNPAVATVDNNGLVTIHNFRPSDEAMARAAEEGFCQIIATTLYDESPMAVVNIEALTTSIEYINSEDMSAGSSATFGQNGIYTLQGVCLKRQASQEDIDALTPGIYIIGGKKVIVK